MVQGVAVPVVLAVVLPTATTAAATMAVVELWASAHHELAAAPAACTVVRL